MLPVHAFPPSTTIDIGQPGQLAPVFVDSNRQNNKTDGRALPRQATLMAPCRLQPTTKKEVTRFVLPVSCQFFQQSSTTQDGRGPGLVNLVDAEISLRLPQQGKSAFPSGLIDFDTISFRRRSDNQVTANAPSILH